jgi:anti-sigma regulatory factor (Ser/Thr protein kinase)
MKFTNEIIETINKYIIENVSDHPHDIVPLVIRHFDIAKPTAVKYMNRLIAQDIIAKDSQGRYPNYHLAETAYDFTYPVSTELEEDAIWRKDILPKMPDMTFNVRQILQYSFTEIVNNVIDHSSAETLTIVLTIDAKMIKLVIWDDGIGIFNKIQKDLGLDDPKYSILELAKGKFTSDPEKHSGEGIFFTSRICDSFMIVSGELTFTGHRRDKDRLFENKRHILSGTRVYMDIDRQSSLSVADIFNEYTDPDKQPGFHKTAIPVKLMEYEGESLLSRSQAKRLINRFDRFLEVVLDFEGVSFIGQAFADEIFRVFANAHPQVRLNPVNCDDSVEKMILHVQGSAASTALSPIRKLTTNDTNEEEGSTD